MIAFRDIKPKAPVHILVVPRLHRASLNDISADDRDMLGETMLFVREVAQDSGLAGSGYKVIINVGRGGGQIVDHLHVHILGGWQTKPTVVGVEQ